MLAALVAMVMASSSPSVLTAQWWIPIAEAAASPKEIWIDKLALCESGNDSTIKILDTNGYYSYSTFQFQMSTWLKYGKPFGATKENIFDGNLQRVVVRSMLDAGGWRHWFTCGKSVSKLLGEYPS